MDDSAFRNTSFTFRLNVLADEAIESGEQIFQRHVGCSIREMRVLRIIDDQPGITFAEIVRATRLERSLTSRIIQRLLAAALIERRGAADDARRYQLFATEAGKARRATAQRITDEAERIITAPLPPDALRQFEASLETLARWVRSDDFVRRMSALDQSLGTAEVTREDKAAAPGA